jgi:oxygen-independent coproporphyrinogen III oxidase
MPTQAISPNCLARYGGASVPRYTSYPTAPHFSAAVGEAEYRRWLEQADPNIPLSVYVHVPFCRSMCWYCGCHTTVTARSDPVDRYISAMEREVALVAERLPARLAIQHLHFGGGTPTLMGPALFERFMAVLRDRFDFAAGAEIAIEIDPRTLAAEMTAMLGAQGVTRASLGVQSFDPQVQRAINRVQSFAETEAAVVGLRQGGVESINLDLIYGLPHQDVASCRETVAQALRLRPDRLSVFGYAHVPSFKRHQRKIDAAALPDVPGRWAQFQAIAGALVAAGYVQVGLDHFALPDDALAIAASSGKLARNFQGYTTDAAPALIGLGASAIGQLPHGYVQNAVLISDYQARVADGRLPVARGYALSRDDRLRGKIIARLMCDYEVDVAEICSPFGEDPDAVYPVETLAKMEEDGLVERARYAVRVLPAARPLVRSVAAAFDAHLAASAGRHAGAV